MTSTHCMGEEGTAVGDPPSPPAFPSSRVHRADTRLMRAPCYATRPDLESVPPSPHLSIAREATTNEPHLAIGSYAHDSGTS